METIKKENKKKKIQTKVFDVDSWGMNYIEIDEDNLIDELSNYEVILFNKGKSFPFYVEGLFEVACRSDKNFLNQFIKKAKYDKVILFKHYQDYEVFCGF